MTAGQVLEMVELRYPCPYEQELRMVHLLRLENMLRRELYTKPRLTMLTESQVLTVESPYDNIYEQIGRAHV